MKRIALLSIMLLLSGCAHPNADGCVSVQIDYLVRYEVEFALPPTRPTSMPTTKADFAYDPWPSWKALRPTTGPTTKRTIATIESNRGSGIVVQKHGDYCYVLTARHLVPAKLEDMMEVRVNGKTAEFVDVSAVADVALIRFKSKKRYPMRLFVSARKRQRVWVIGYPGKWPYRLGPCEFAVNVAHWSKGTIVWNGAACPGVSGSPILDDWGNIVGMVTDVMTIGGVRYSSIGMGVSSYLLFNAF